MPLECLHDLVLDLHRLNAAATGGVNAAPELVKPPPNSEAAQTAADRRSHCGLIARCLYEPADTEPDVTGIIETVVV